ncbi:MAG: ABC transporter substrate-binding protein [Actinomycetota bacterium]
MRKVFVLIAAATLLLAGCAQRSSTPSSAAEGTDACAKENLNLLVPGKLTIGADKPAYPPWFVGNDPANGKGYEGAVARAVAEQVGFTPDEIAWTVVPFNKSYAPGPKDFDVYLTQVSITPERAEVVEFSEGYYDVAQALVAKNDSSIANATSVADLVNAKLGAQVGTTSLTYIEDEIQPTEEPYVYDTTNDAKSALENGQIDGIVVDLPTAFYITAVQIPGSKVVGQFPQTGGAQEQFGFVLEKGNPLVDCVNEAITALRSDGTLDEIEQTWLADKTNAPVFQ